jgi:hypothetical protein
MAEIQPWERQEEETAKAYEAFSEYRDMGADRSLAKVGYKLGKSKAQMEKWSKKYSWVARAEAWDIEEDRLIRVALTKDIGAMRKRHADVAKAMLIKAARALQKIPDDEIKATDISRMVDVATKLERISKGDVGDVIEERQGEAVADPVQFYIPDNGRDNQEEQQ